jgi:hypothetical protein
VTKPIPFTDSEIRNIMTELEIERALDYVMGDNKIDEVLADTEKDKQSVTLMKRKA